jgi:hypothetical protein
MQVERNAPYHTFMIAQDADDIFISTNSYTNAYRRYLFSPTPATVRPRTIDTTDMLEIQEFGPFSVSTRSHLQLLVHVVLALMVQGLLESSASVMIKPTWNEMASDDESNEM